MSRVGDDPNINGYYHFFAKCPAYDRILHALDYKTNQKGEYGLTLKQAYELILSSAQIDFLNRKYSKLKK